MYGYAVEISVKKLEATLLLRGEGGLQLWVHKETPVGADVLLART